MREATGSSGIPPGFLLPFGRRRSLLEPSCPTGDIRLPHGRPTKIGSRRLGPQPGFPRSTRVRYDRGGCPLYPGAVVSVRANGSGPPGTCRFSTASPTAQLKQPIDRHPQSRDIIQGFSHLHPSGLPLARNSRMEREPSGFPPSSAPCRYQQRTSGRGLITWTLIRIYTIDIVEPPKVYSLTNVRPRVAPPPWGVPSTVGVNQPFSTTPAFSHPAIIPLPGNEPSDASR